MSSTRLLCLLLAVCALAGCDTFRDRSDENADAFAALTPAERRKLQRGTIELGSSSDLVYIALGHPDEQHEKTTPRGREMTWVYHEYHEDFVGTVPMAYRRVLVAQPGARRYLLYFDPVYVDTYRAHSRARIRIELLDGKVVRIRLPKR